MGAHRSLCRPPVHLNWVPACLLTAAATVCSAQPPISAQTPNTQAQRRREQHQAEEGTRGRPPPRGFARMSAEPSK